MLHRVGSVLAVSAVVLLTVALTATGCDRFRDPSERGFSALDDGRYDEAVTEFGLAIDKASADGDTEAMAIAYANRCFAKDALGQHEEAVDDCTEALALRPDDVEILNNRGVAYLNAGLRDEAEADFDAAIDAEPDYAEAYANRGRVHIDREAFGLAIEDLTLAIERNPELVEAYANRAFSHDSLGNVDEALDDYDRALEVQREQYTLFQRGMLHYRYGRFEEAYQDFKEAADMDQSTMVGYMAQSQADLLASNPDARRQGDDESSQGSEIEAKRTPADDESSEDSDSSSDESED